MKKEKEKKKQRSKKEKKAPKKQTARAQGKRSGERSKQEKKGGRKKEKTAAKQSAEKPKKRANPSRTAGGRVPQGRTLKTQDKNLDQEAEKPKKKTNPSRTESGRVPQGRTLKTQDKYLDKKAKDPEKERPVVVIEANENNDLAVVQLTSREGKDRTRLKNYQQGESLFKHYVEIEDDEGKPIRVNEKFKENHPNMDVSEEDIEKIRNKVFNASRPAPQNREKMKQFKDKKIPETNPFGAMPQSNIGGNERA